MIRFESRPPGKEGRRHVRLAEGHGELNRQNAVGISIAKWEFILARLGEDGWETVRDGGRASCALCLIFHDREALIEACGACPVYRRTGQTACQGTPYDSFMNNVIRATAIGTPEDRQLLIDAAQAEIDFLKSLRKQIHTGDQEPL